VINLASAHGLSFAAFRYFNAAGASEDGAIGEEAAEVIIAAKNAAPDELSWELADLLYHSLVLLVQQGVPLEAVWRELRRRHG